MADFETPWESNDTPANKTEKQPVSQEEINNVAQSMVASRGIAGPEDNEKWYPEDEMAQMMATLDAWATDGSRDIS